MAYYEGEINPLNNCGGYGNGGWGGNDAWWIIILLIFGWGNNFGGNGFGGRGAGSELVGYELGKVATTNDVASGFNNSAVLSSLNDLKLGQSSMQNFINQGFSGINTQLMSGFHGVDNAICTLGYQNQQGFNSLSHQLSDCCCATQRAIDGINYNMAKSTCDIVQAINLGNQKVIDYMQSEKIDTLNRKLAVAEGQISQYAQTNAIVSALKQPCPIPAYQVPNPNCCYNGCGGSTI
jgi:hypothetical protein